MATTILCVDDERMVLVALREQLQRHLGDDVIVETADDGESGLEILTEVLEDGALVPLVITDHIMPGIKGDELVARVHELSPETRSVMLTGQATADAVGNALNTGGLYRFLTKPWNQDDLILTVREALRSHARERELAAQRVTLREVYEAALDLTASLAAADRYKRLLGRLAPIVGAERAALVRKRGEGWALLARMGEQAEAPYELPASATVQWAEDANAQEPVRRASLPGATALFGVERCRSGVSIPLRSADDAVGLLLLGASEPGAFRDVGDDRMRAAGALAAASLHTAELVDKLEESLARRTRVAQELVRQANTLLAGVLRGDSRAAQRLRSDISRLADLDPTRRVLVLGPPGSGPEAVARAIHAESPRAERPFILVSCAMLRSSDELLGSEATTGKLELARGGTLYLRGVEHLSPALGRALFDTLGGPKGRELDVRVIGSTVAGIGGTPDLLHDEDAWHPKQRVPLPPLRKRTEDIPAMAELFLRVQRNRLGLADLTLSEASLDRLRGYAWPGNALELMNVIERAALTANGPVAEVDQALLELGHTVGSYTLTELLGAGGMGEVWQARHKHLARPAAVKLIQARGGAGFDSAAIQRFRREAEATARLRSPHTVELYDFGATEESGFYYVMELLEGLDLQQLVANHGPLPPERAVYLLGQALRSLSEAHDAGLVHRDIKPANIFVSRLGADYDFVKLLDFGLVTALDGIDDEVTQTGTLTGTPQFMAPEHAAEQGVDGRTDLYALGGVAFWMLTGERVFASSSTAALLLAHVTQTPDRPSSRLLEPLPDGLDEWVLALLEKAPDDRPANAREAHRTLMEIELPERWTQERAEAWWGDAKDAPRVDRNDLQSAPTQIEKPHAEKP